MMYLAIDMGISAEEFWDMSPRAICMLLEARAELNRQNGRSGRGDHRPHGQDRESLPRLNYIPRP